MSIPSPALKKSTQVEFTIKVDGKPIAKTISVNSIDVWANVNKVPKAKLVIFDGTPAKNDFIISNQATFLPGNKVEIAAGYKEAKVETIFKGVIVKQGLEITNSRASKLVVELSDEAIKMTLERKDALFPKIKDSELIGKLISQNGLSKDVASTNTVHEDIVQYYCTDWDLMLTRAEQNGLVATVFGGKVTVKPPDTSQTPVLNVEYGKSMLDFDGEMDASTQFASSSIKSSSWNVAEQKVAESGPGSVKVKEPGNVSSSELAKVFNVKTLTQQTGANLAKTSLQDWSSAELLKSKLSKIRGSVRFQGSALAQVGKVIELAGLSERFNGSVFVSGVHHNISGGKWLTTADFGLSAQWFATTAPDIAAPGASGQLPPISGLQTGIVKKIAPDPGGEFRVFVNLPLLHGKSDGVWARLSTVYASSKVGAVFYPEADDEVIVGFMNNDPRHAIILGSVYSKKRAPAYPPDKKNTKKAIVTQSKLEITFDEESKIIEINTTKHSIKLDDKSGAVSIKDGNRNTVSLSKGGIMLDSASNIQIKAKGNITIDAKQNLKTKAALNASMEGLQVANKAKAKVSASGAIAEFKSSGITTVRGTLLKLN